MKGPEVLVKNNVSVQTWCPQTITNQLFLVEIELLSKPVDWLSLSWTVKKGPYIRKVCLFFFLYMVLLDFYKNIWEVLFYNNSIAELPKTICKRTFSSLIAKIDCFSSCIFIQVDFVYRNETSVVHTKIHHRRLGPSILKGKNTLWAIPNLAVYVC